MIRVPQFIIHTMSLSAVFTDVATTRRSLKDHSTSTSQILFLIGLAVGKTQSLLTWRLSESVPKIEGGFSGRSFIGFIGHSVDPYSRRGAEFPLPPCRNLLKVTWSPEILYTPVPLLRQPLTLVRGMIRDLFAARHLAYRLLIRNLASQYRRSLLGYLWAFVTPIVATGGFVFLNSHQVLRIVETNVPYGIYVFVGILLWQTFTDAFHCPLQWVLAFRSVLGRVNFPREALILGALGEVLVQLAIRIILLLILFLWFRIGLTPIILLAPVAIVALIGLGLMFGVLLVPVGLLYGDIEKGTHLATMLWFLMTPVIYPPPISWPGTLLNQLNPVSPLLTTARELLIGSSLTQLDGFFIVASLTVLCLCIGWMLFRLALPHLVERVGS
jgi:lipopolysaccharide transport system permease protein